ncbi:MAG: glycoside hydrolase family 3 N-terminal domain-containing protein [Candidatus Sericytochromatia bacterium]
MNLDINKKIAQLICVEIRINEIYNDPKKLEDLKESFRKNQWGSVILFDGDIETASKIIDDLQKNAEIPLFVCADLERGAGQHFKGATHITSNMAITATNNIDNAYKAGKITAQEAKDIGLNIIFGPSVDVNSNPKNPIINIRSFGEDPVKVADMAQAFIKGCEYEKVLTTAKHFPGHGDTSTDSHVEVPLVKKSLKALEKLELYPFKQVIEDEAPAIMSSHIALPKLDDSMLPATFSYKIMTELLREKMNFNGLVFTDALNMDGAKLALEHSVYVSALLAGCDILLMPPEPEKALENIREALEKNIISHERLDESYSRILKYKERYCDLSYKKSLKRINSEKNKLFSQQVADEALTKIKGNLKFPIKLEEKKVVNILIDQDDNSDVWNLLSCKLSKEYGIKTLVINTKSEKNTLLELEDKINDKDLIVISFFSQMKAWKKHMHPKKEVLTWIEKNIIKNKEHIVFAFSDPYFINKIPEVKNYYCTYSASQESQLAVIKFLFEGLEAKGISPIQVKF